MRQRVWLGAPGDVVDQPTSMSDRASSPGVAYLGSCARSPGRPEWREGHLRRRGLLLKRLPYGQPNSFRGETPSTWLAPACTTWRVRAFPVPNGSPRAAAAGVAVRWRGHELAIMSSAGRRSGGAFRQEAGLNHLIDLGRR